MQKTLFGATLGLFLGAGSAAYALCVSDLDREAFHVRALQTDLMVAALTCDSRDDYNEFASTYRTQLVEHGRALKQRFHAHHGTAAGERELNRYITALANRTSQRSIAKRDAYCDGADRMFEALENGEARNMVAFSLNRPRAEIDVPAPCRIETRLVESKQ